MEIELKSPKTLVVKPAETLEVTKLVVDKVLDDLENKKVIVWIKNLPAPFEVGDLSNENYDNPPWTNELLQEALSKIADSFDDQKEQ